MSLPEKPITRKEAYLAKIAGQDVPVPEWPNTREEAYLDQIAKNGGGNIPVNPKDTSNINIWIETED